MKKTIKGINFNWFLKTYDEKDLVKVDISDCKKVDLPNQPFELPVNNFNLNDIEQKEPEIKQLNSQSYHESSLILSLLSQLNSAELSPNNDRASPNPNITEFDNIPIAILKNNKADLLKKLGISFDTDNGLALSPELPQLANIYGYQINGSADNPIISAK